MKKQRDKPKDDILAMALKHAHADVKRRARRRVVKDPSKPAKVPDG